MTKKNRVVYFNGQLVAESEARISIYDSALMFGDMVFEMTRSFKGAQFMLREHIERMYTGLKILRIDIPLTPEEMEQVVYDTIEANKPAFAEDDEFRVMIDVSRGVLGIYENIDGLPKGPNVIVAVFPLKWTVSGMGHLFDSGINAVITSQRAIPGDLLDPKIKNRSRIHYLMANIQASLVTGEDNWALLLDPDGYIAEGSGDNFFIVKDNTIITPEGRNILRGISRSYVMNDLAPRLGFNVREANIEPYDVHTADEAFMTGTPFCMLPVTTLDQVPVGDGKVGPVFSALLEQWNTNVGVDIATQIKAWNAHTVSASDAPTPYRFKGPKKKANK